MAELTRLNDQLVIEAQTRQLETADAATQTNKGVAITLKMWLQTQDRLQQSSDRVEELTCLNDQLVIEAQTRQVETAAAATQTNRGRWLPKQSKRTQTQKDRLQQSISQRVEELTRQKDRLVTMLDAQKCFNADLVSAASNTILGLEERCLEQQSRLWSQESTIEAQHRELKLLRGKVSEFQSFVSVMEFLQGGETKIAFLKAFLRDSYPFVRLS